MQIIWRNDPPMSTNQIIAFLGSEHTWKPQTVLTLLVRLIEKGYLHSEKPGKERIYSPLISYEDYLHAETENFFNKFHKNSLRSLISSLYDGSELSENEITDLRDWLETNGVKK